MEDHCKDCETEGNKGYELGVIVGMQRAAKILLENSANWFKNRNDAMAQNYRMTSQRPDSIASGDRKLYDEKYHPVIAAQSKPKREAK